VGMETTMLDGPKVSDLADLADGTPATATPAANLFTPASDSNERPPAAGVHQYAAPTTKWPPGLGRAADLMPPTSKQVDAPGDPVPATQPTASPAKNPAVTADVKVGAADAGPFVQGTAKVTYALSPKDKISLELSEQWSRSDTPGAPEALDHQLGVSWERLLVRSGDGKFRLTSSVGASFGVSQPLNGGDIATRFGVKGEIAGSFKPNDVFELRGSIYAQNQWFSNADSLFAVGGDLSGVITDPTTRIAGAMGVRGELPFNGDAPAWASVYGRITIPTDSRVSIYGEGFTDITGSRSGLLGGISVSL
jgi:hypothetical protein